MTEAPGSASASPPSRTDARSNRPVWGAAAIAALLGLAGFVVSAPDYLAGRGFPVDDSWIHAVYGRELARSLLLAYNPGVPATGATSPLWAWLVAVPHLLARDVTTIVVMIKLLGFGLHLCAAYVAARAVEAPSRAVRPEWISAALVAANPALVAASLSGMEVGLAGLFGAALCLGARRGHPLGYAALCSLAAWARPELACLALAMPVLVAAARRKLRPELRMVAAAAAGLVVSFGLLALRNMAVSGRPLPATFYAKVDTLPYPWLKAQWVGFTELLAQLPLGSPALLVAFTGLACWAFLSRREGAPREAAGVFLAGLLFCAVSFRLIPPIDPAVFYHQRYPMPALPLLLAPAPALLLWALRQGLAERARRLVAGAFLLFALLVYGFDMPGRSTRLANDAHNIDDVQVALGRSLSTASPDEVVWAVDAGAIRYFGAAFVVDTLALNTPEMLEPDAQAFLDQRRPRFIEVVPGWSQLDQRSASKFPGRRFAPSTPYTVTNFPPMQEHYLFACRGLEGGRYNIRGRILRFSCPPPPH